MSFIRVLKLRWIMQKDSRMSEAQAVLLRIFMVRNPFR